MRIGSERNFTILLLNIGRNNDLLRQPQIYVACFGYVYTGLIR